jgi:hypothetical protein
MGIAKFFDKTVVIRRLRTLSGNKKAFQATATADGAIQEMDRYARAKMGIVDERGWIAWFDIETDIKAGDVITRQDTGELLKVLEATQKDYGINQHLEVMLVGHNA